MKQLLNDIVDVFTKGEQIINYEYRQNLAEVYKKGIISAIKMDMKLKTVSKMRRLNIIKGVVLCVLCLSLAISAGEFPQVIASDTVSGLVVEMKERYGEWIKDTCTALLLSEDGIYWTTHRQGFAGSYPREHISAVRVRRLEDEQ